MRSLASRAACGTLLAVASGCAGGEPMGGDVLASFRGTSFEPAFGVAIEGLDEVNPDGMILMFSDAELDCDNAAEGPNPEGFYVVVSTAARELGEVSGLCTVSEIARAEYPRERNDGVQRDDHRRRSSREGIHRLHDRRRGGRVDREEHLRRGPLLLTRSTQRGRR